MLIQKQEETIKSVQEQIDEFHRLLLTESQNFSSSEDVTKIISRLKYLSFPVINDLSPIQIDEVEECLTNLKNGLTKQKHSDFVRYAIWLISKLEFQLKSKDQEFQRVNHPKHHHPIRPRRGDVFLTELGQNIGKEINDQHLVVVIQNNKANLFSNTVVVIPISSNGKLYESHEKIEEKDIKRGRLDKLPSKAKTEQIQFIDKARFIHRVAELEDVTMERISQRLKKNLDIL